MVLEDFLRPTQKQLFKMLCRRFKRKIFFSKDKFILVRGQAPVMLVSHLDTVHVNPVEVVCKSKNGNILMSPQGIGGDDRCGVYALVKIYERSPVKPWLLFTCDEETGCFGADAFCFEYVCKNLPKELDSLNCIIEIDRRGSNDAVYYDCDNADFEKYITSKGFKTSYGSFSDISHIAPKLGVAAVNLSSGYYNAHQLHEYINRAELEIVIRKVIGIVAESDKLPRFEYVRKEPSFYQSTWSRSYLKKGSDNSKTHYEKLYEELLNVYTRDELDSYREQYGDEVLKQIYDDECEYFDLMRNEEITYENQQNG